MPRDISHTEPQTDQQAMTHQPETVLNRAFLVIHEGCLSKAAKAACPAPLSQHLAKPEQAGRIQHEPLEVECWGLQSSSQGYRKGSRLHSMILEISTPP